MHHGQSGSRRRSRNSSERSATLLLDAEAQPTLEEMRAGVATMGEIPTIPDGVSWEAVDAGGVPAIWAIPADGRR